MRIHLERLSSLCGLGDDDVATGFVAYTGPMSTATSARIPASSKVLATAAGMAAVGIAVLVVFAILPRGSGSLASSFSDFSCAASGATSEQVFVPSGLVAGLSADNTGAIQGAIDSAASAGGGVVALPAGTFLINGHLIMKSNVKLTGVGQKTVLKAGPSFLNSTGPDGGYPVVTTAGASNVTIANLTADQSGNTLNGNTDPSERLRAFLIDVRNSHNAVIDEVYTRNPFTYSIAVVGSDDFCVAHCNTQVTTSGRYDQLDGIHVLGSNTGQVIDNYVDQRIGTDGDDGLVAHTIGTPVYDVLYAENMVRGGNHGDGMQLAVGDYPIHGVTIRDNYFWGSPFGIRTGYYDSGINGSVYNVSITGNRSYNLVPGSSFSSGENAIDIGGFGAIAPVAYITVKNNYICHAGTIIVLRGVGNIVSHNHACP
jgi:polygalacturonase